MDDVTLSRLLAYSDWANAAVANAAIALTDAQLDHSLDIGPVPGSLRRILLHTLAGETVWLSRQKGNVENAWPNEKVPTPIPEVAAAFERVRGEREAFLSGTSNEKLENTQTYRDSKGTLFKATLRDMLLQGLMHSAHHRAQAVNAIRRVGGAPPEVDLMYHFRATAE